MQKCILSFSMLLLSCSASYGQPAVTIGDISVNQVSELYLATIPADFSPGNAGADQTWNFTSLSLVATGTNTTVPVADTNYANTFPMSNHCVHYEGPYGQSYHYYSVVADRFEKNGTVFVGQAVEQYTNPRTLVQFPYTFNSVFTDVFKTDLMPTSLTATVTYDGYGTLILPFGTYTNVIRQKIVIDGREDYIWYNSSPFFPLFETFFAEGTAGLNKPTSLSLPDSPRHYEMIVFPNPVTDKINIKFPVPAGAEAAIYDCNGKCITVKKFDGTQTWIDASQITPGLYMVRLTDPRGNHYTKRFIKS